MLRRSWSSDSLAFIVWKRFSFGGCFSFAFFGGVGEPRVFCVRVRYSRSRRFGFAEGISTPDELSDWDTD